MATDGVDRPEVEEGSAMIGPEEPLAVRRARDDDAAALLELSLAAISHSAAEHYEERQLTAWAARRTLAGHRWLIGQTLTFVALAGPTVAGFASVALEPAGGLQAGEVDQLFVSPRHGGRGVARLLLDAVAAAGAEAGLEELVTHASWRAVPVFERLGYRRVEVEHLRLGDVELTRVLMRKVLGAGPADR
jgi:putative acetyltransferase